MDGSEEEIEIEALRNCKDCDGSGSKDQRMSNPVRHVMGGEGLRGWRDLGHSPKDPSQSAHHVEEWEK